ncbi:hypothetical protein BLOT_003261 [Blomia tropicalis]|nr:hypothetical protein BLOT_003261 [Blomia tropicalis]
MANPVPNDGRSRTKRLKIKGTKRWKITNQTIDDQIPNDEPTGTKRWTITNQTMANPVPNDGRSNTKRSAIKNQ